MFLAIGCSSSVRPVDAHAVRARAQPLTAAPKPPEPQRSDLLGVLRGIQNDFGTTLTPRQLSIRLKAPAVSSEALGSWVFEPQGSLFQVDANAMSVDSPIDWLRVTIRPELAILLGDLTQLFSNDYDVLGRGGEFVAVEFSSSRRMHIAAEIRNDRPAYVYSAPVVSVQLRRPGYDPSFAKLVPQDR